MPQRRTRAPRALPWLVLGAHLLALLLVGHALRPRDREPAATTTRPLWLRLLPEPARAPANDPERATQARPAARPEPRAVTRAAPERPAQQAAPPTAAITLPPAEAPAATPPPDPPSSAPLDLRLAPGRRHAPPPAALARDDPRANTARDTSGQRMARTLGTDQTLHEGVQPDGTRSFRRGRDCVLARPARESQLNPYNQSINPTPRLIGDC